VIVLAASVGADEPPKTIDLGGLTFQAPAGWKLTTPTSAMRKAQFEIEPAKGDKTTTELAVFALPGGAGGIDANVERWRSQFKDKDGNTPKAEVTKVKGQNTDVTRVEISGHWFPPAFPGQPRLPDLPDARLLGAIVLTSETGYYLRMVGPEKTVASVRADFEKLATSIKVGAK
jgi:hypothetical protein